MYSEEAKSLESKLKVAEMNAPKERKAQALANSEVKAKLQDNPGMDKKELSKTKKIALDNARASVGASGKDSRISLTDKEWEAIQAGAISDTKLTQILRYTDSDSVRQMAMPKTTTQLSSAKVNKIASMQSSGYTIAEIADSLGVSTSTVSNYIRTERGE